MKLRDLSHYGLCTGVTVWPMVASACPVCFTASEPSRLAFFWTAVFMTLAPLLLIGSAVFWLWKRIQAASVPEDTVAVVTLSEPLVSSGDGLPGATSL